MYRLPNISRSITGSRTRSRSTSPTRSMSQFARNAIQAPIIPRYRGDTVVPMKLSAMVDTAIPVVAPTSVQPSVGMTKTPIGNPTAAIPTTTATPATVVSRKPRASRKPKTPATPIPAHIPITRNPLSTSPAKNPVPIPAAAAPAALSTPFPMPHFTQPIMPHIPTSVGAPYPLPHFTQPIMAPHIPAPAVGGYHYNPTTPMTGVPAGYHYIPPTSTGIPSGGHGIPPHSSPLWPWLTGTAIGVGVGLGVVSLTQDKQESVEAPTTVPSLTWVPTDAGMGTVSALIDSPIEQQVIPVMKRVFEWVFSWAGLCSTFVLLCFVEVIRAKLFGPGTSAFGSGADSSSTSTTFSADPIPIATSTGPVFIPPLDLATARVTLDATAKTYVEQLIAYYEALALTTDRESYSERQKLV